jgi:16S rRNA (adenine1518-N6/adenine1519-N6)-dimethyltransferase
VNNAASLADLPPLRETIKRHGLAARHDLGQHFLFDLNLTRRIARAAGDLSDSTTIEIGPGPGGLTRGLLMEGAGHVVAVERDPRCRAALEEIAAACPGRLTLVAADALEVGLDELGPRPRRIVSNLPYNVGTQLLLNWLDAVARDPATLESLTLMFQKEVADRLLAAPGTKAYGRLSVLTQWLCETSRVLNLPREAFTPPPKVASTVVHLVPRSAPLYPADPTAFQAVTAAAFGQRRKMLRQSLKRLTPDAAGLCEAAGVPPTARAEDLTIAQFCTLARETERAA